MGQYTNLVERVLNEQNGQWYNNDDQYAYLLDDPKFGNGDRFSIFDKKGKLLTKQVIPDETILKHWKEIKGKDLPFKSAEGLTSKVFA